MIGAGFWLSERALHACRKFRARGHFYGQFWQAFPKEFRRPHTWRILGVETRHEAFSENKFMQISAL